MEEWLESFLRAGWVRLEYRQEGTRRSLSRVFVADVTGLEEFAAPGMRAARQTALSDAKELLHGLDHPVAARVSALLRDLDTDSLEPRLIHALAAVASFAQTGETCARRVFSARYLGDSKALKPLGPRLERLLGPLEAIGIRDGAAVTLIGGTGSLALSHPSPHNAPGQTLDLNLLPPFVGLPHEQIRTITRIRFPPLGILVVENLTVFEACCRKEVAGADRSLCVWSQGYPGRSVRTFVEQAVTAGCHIRVWADLDLDGVRIARLIHRWASGKARPWRMSPADLQAARAALPLSAAAAAAIRSDIESNPDALLTDTLEAILAKGRWAEQEALLESSNRRTV